VNQYTLIMDLFWPVGHPSGFASFINYDLSNTSDGDVFLNINGQFGQGGGGYEGDTVFTLGEWHRVAFAVDMSANPPVLTKFLDGVKHADQTAPNNQLDGERRTLPVAGAVLFADGDDGERRDVYVNSIQVRSVKLSDEELAALGGPSAGGIPVAISGTETALEARIKYRWDGSTLRLAWPATFGGYTLESSPTVNGPDWQPVTGVTGPCATIEVTTGTRFYRLRQ
jgi:hypothetical protein